jgi:hypothetical protein
MVMFRRISRNDGRVNFNIPELDNDSRVRLIEEIGLIVEAAGKPHGKPNSAQLYYVMFMRDDGTQGRRLGGFSVPAEIAEDVAASLVSHGHSVE